MLESVFGFFRIILVLVFGMSGVKTVSYTHLVLGDISTGASNDISRATQLARKMVGTYGMSEQLGNVAFVAGHDEVFIGKSMAQTRPYSEKTAAEMDGEIRRIMDDAYARCTAIRCV